MVEIWVFRRKEMQSQKPLINQGELWSFLDPSLRP